MQSAPAFLLLNRSAARDMNPLPMPQNLPHISISPEPSRSRLAVTAWCLTIALLAAHLLPCAVQTGMYLDGTMYSAISRNMAAGFGDLWHPAFSPGAGTGYNEHPTLAFLLQSYAYRIFGDHFWVDKLYSGATGLLTLILVVAIWRRLAGSQSSLAEYNWLPVVLWLIWPAWTWQYENNWLENTLGVFTCFAVYGALRAGENARGELKWILLAGLSLVAAALTKGPVGLFPLATPLVAWAILRRQSLSRAAAATAILLFVLCAGVALLLLQPAAREYLARYFHQQVVASLAGQREHSTAWGHFFILKTIKNGLKLPALVTVAVISIDDLRRRLARRQSQPAFSPAEAPAVRPGLFCLVTALSASLPIMASPKQWEHYALPSYPFFALALAFWCLPSVVRIVNSSKLQSADALHRALRAAAAISCIVLAGASYLLAGRPSMDPEKLHDTLVLRRQIPPTTVVGVSAEMTKDWSFFAYLSRWDNIGIEHQNQNHNDYYLTRANETDPSPDGYLAVPTEMVQYRLYRRCEAVRSAAGRPSKSDQLAKTRDPAAR